MSILDFTAEEINLVAVYMAEGRDKVIAKIANGYMLMDDGDMKGIAISAVRKLYEMTDEEFSTAGFAAADDTGEL